MKRYGSAMNFFGGLGEVAHKFFVKAPGLKTQRRVGKFAIQTANQDYDIMVTRHALRSLEQEQNMKQESNLRNCQLNNSAGTKMMLLWNLGGNIPYL